MVASRFLAALAACNGLGHALCPYMENDARELPAKHPPVPRDVSSAPKASGTDEFLGQFELNDGDVYMTSDVGGPFSDQESLSAGERGPTLLEDYIFRQKVRLVYAIHTSRLT